VTGPLTREQVERWRPERWRHDDEAQGVVEYVRKGDGVGDTELQRILDSHELLRERAEKAEKVCETIWFYGPTLTGPYAPKRAAHVDIDPYDEWEVFVRDR
jgi:hypothetical protein